MVVTLWAAVLSPSIPAFTNVERSEIRQFLILLFGVEIGLLVLPIAVSTLIVSRIVTQDPEAESGTHGVFVDSMLWPVFVTVAGIIFLEGAILLVDFFDPGAWVPIRGPQNLVIWSGGWLLAIIALLSISMARLFNIVASPQPSSAYRERGRTGQRIGRASSLALLTTRSVDATFDREARNRAVLEHPDVGQ